MTGTGFHALIYSLNDALLKAVSLLPISSRAALKMPRTAGARELLTLFALMLSLEICFVNLKILTKQLLSDKINVNILNTGDAL